MSFVAMSGLIFGLPNPQTATIKFWFWVVTIGIITLRLVDAFHWQTRVRDTDYNPKWSFLRFHTGAVAMAFVWAAYSITLFNSMNTIELATTLVILSAMAAGAATVLAPSRTLLIFYCSMLILPISIQSVVNSKDDFTTIGVLGLLFWVSMLFTGFKSNNFFHKAIRLKHANNELVQQMKIERNEVRRINEDLRRSNEKLDHINASLEAEVTRRTNEMHRLSNRDPLTLLLNRLGFIRQLEEIIRTTEKLHNTLAVLFVDLDGFKQVNDSLGHWVGDKVLVEVATRLKRFCDPDHLARWGGDEFVIVLPYANEDTAIAVAQAARSGISDPIIVEENQISLDASIGIALYPDHGKTAQILIQEADLTMYNRKRNARGSVGVFNQAIYQMAREEQDLRDGLRRAIENGQLFVMFQPILSAAKRQPWAVEALLRWEYGDRSVPPSVFIPLAEKTGLIHDIGTWVLHRACIVAAQWPQESEVAVSVNVSVIQLMDDRFVNTLDKVLKSSGLDPTRLHLEITESVFADNRETVVRQVNAIKARKVQISIDDFGTGFSSLSQLQSLSFDHIKIDRSFVQKLEEGSDTIIRATLMIAREFGCKTIAEGIESNAHAERLIEMGVDCLQGFHYARPLSAEAIRQWLENQKQ
ncbi:EAL domain-containing protein [Alteromonas aestuariivivens]|uniref:EAL domain-containing protein n=2 Tax=Alteromonas aestuariivivens TaxID=1938339 RepID=A0A3D8MFM0_9ALTE|nr:EAL domain-containing protein [Alteromonas aestuariivivens]